MLEGTLGSQAKVTLPGVPAARVTAWSCETQQRTRISPAVRAIFDSGAGSVLLLLFMHIIIATDVP